MGLITKYLELRGLVYGDEVRSHRLDEEIPMPNTIINNESSFEHNVRELIDLHITNQCREIIMLEHKTIGDIIICREGNLPAIFLIEVKYYKPYERIGIGSSGGKGIQPEILKTRPNTWNRIFDGLLVNLLMRK